MTTSEAARKLVFALEELVRISELQNESLSASRSRAKKLEREIDDHIESLGSLEGVRKLAANEDHHQKTQEAHEVRMRHEERERAFMDAFHALMVLWSDSAVRDASERTFELLRDLRINDATDRQLFLQMPAPSEFDPKEVSLESIRSSHREFRAKMKEWMHQRESAWDKQIARSDALLREALQVAKTIVAHW